jgi:hypothetical protein
MSEISELFDRDVLNKPHTNEEIDRIIAWIREYRARMAADEALRKAQGFAPRRLVKYPEFEERERRAAAKEAERAAKAKAKAEKDAAKAAAKAEKAAKVAAKRKPRQIDLEEAIAATTKQSPPIKQDSQQPANGTEDAPQP